MTTEHVEDLNKLMIQRRQKIEEMQKMNIKPYGKKYKTSHHTADIVENFADLEGEQVSLMGRIMALRTHGKASFADLMDMKGRIQLYVKVDMVGEEKYNFFNTLDIGDIIGVSGIVFKPVATRFLYE